MTTLHLVCRCGARLDYADESWRTAEAAEEFRRVHVREGCGVEGDGLKCTVISKSGAVLEVVEIEPPEHIRKGLGLASQRAKEGMP